MIITNALDSGSFMLINDNFFDLFEALFDVEVNRDCEQRCSEMIR